MRYRERTSDYPGPLGDYMAPPLTTAWRDEAIGECALRVHLPPATEITLDLTMTRYVNTPTYAAPWQAAQEEGGDATA